MLTPAPIEPVPPAAPVAVVVPGGRLDVVPAQTPRLALGCLGLVVAALALFVLADAVRRGNALFVAVFGGILLLTAVPALWLLRRSAVRSVRAFTADGVVRGDGRRLPWADLDRVVYTVVTNAVYRTRGAWAIELRFRGGAVATVVPYRTANYADVAAFVRSLPVEHEEVAALPPV